MLFRKRYDSNEEVIAETEAYFERLNGSFYEKGIEILEKQWEESVIVKGDYGRELSRILPKSCLIYYERYTWGTTNVNISFIPRTHYGKMKLFFISIYFLSVDNTNLGIYTHFPTIKTYKNTYFIMLRIPSRSIINKINFKKEFL